MRGTSAMLGRLDVVNWADGTYSVTVDGDEWFMGSAPTFRHEGRILSTQDGSLQLKDWWLRSHAAEHHWVPQGRDSPTFTTSVKVYDTYAIFTQSFPNGARNISAGDRDDLVSAYPAFTPKWIRPKGVVSFQGDMTGSDTKTGSWSAKTGTWTNIDSTKSPPIGHGISGTGPVVVFDANLNTSLVLSPFSNFMAANQKLINGSLSYGVMGGVSDIPEGFSVSTIVSLASGVNAAMDSWGDILLKSYGKERYAYQRDFAMQYLGYSTDNGAYYYYQTEPRKNYEDTLVDVLEYAKNESIPYKYVLLDSWWYFKGKGDGVKSWEARPDIFPDGSAGFWKKTKWPTQLHNRMWSPDTTYAKQNGGSYNFIIDGSSVAVPDDQQFWNDLIGNKTKEAGAFMYEQDWLDVEFDKSKSLGENATLGRTWMMQMDRGATHANQTIQMCMSHVRHILQSVEMLAVTNARASGDYHPGNNQWNIGTTALLAHAVGLGPSKDNYWSTAVQHGTHYGPSTTEPHSRFQSAVISLSNGPVAPSDKIGASNSALIMRCCDASGRLLSADRPAAEIDAHFTYAAGFNGVNGHMWATYATVSSFKFSYVMGISLQSPYNLSVNELGYTGSIRLLAIQADDTATIAFAQDAPLQFKTCGLQDFQLYLIAPPTGSYTLLGEPTKWISVSSQRFSDLTGSGSHARVKVHGQAGERVTVRWADPEGRISSTKCTLSEAGEATSAVSPSGATCNSSFEVLI